MRFPRATRQPLPYQTRDSHSGDTLSGGPSLSVTPIVIADPERPSIEISAIQKTDVCGICGSHQKSFGRWALLPPASQRPLRESHYRVSGEDDCCEPQCRLYVVPPPKAHAIAELQHTCDQIADERRRHLTSTELSHSLAPVAPPRLPTSHHNHLTSRVFQRAPTCALLFPGSQASLISYL